MQKSLQVTLLAVFALYITIVFGVQMYTRVQIELPELYAQEHENDLRSVEQVRNLFNQIMTGHELTVEDLGHWQVAYDLTQSERGSEEFQSQLAIMLGTNLSTLQANEINGLMYLTSEKEILFETSLDLETGDEAPLLELTDPDFFYKPFAAKDETIGGVADSNLGPLMFAVSQILDDETKLDPRGYLVSWRKFDQSVISHIQSQLDVELDIRELSQMDEADYVTRILESEGGVLPRDENTRLHWLINKADGTPFLLVSQRALPRAFDETILSFSGIVGFSTSAVLLVLLALFLSRYLVAPIVKASRVMESIYETSDLTRRLSLDRDDELGEMFSKFDELLARVETQEKRLIAQRDELEKMTDLDPLTGVNNRRYFERVFDRCWRQSLRSERPVACLMVDVDYFKAYNDYYGHPAGDEVLVAVAGALSGNVHRATDYLSRFGGEEFVLVLLDTARDTAEGIGERIHRAVRKLAIPHIKSEVADFISVSVGVAALVPTRELNSDDLLRMADEALYKAKQTGRDRVVLAEEVESF